ncbi:toll-like receptor 13 [Octopus bimaculoides]|uniref:TIR domain-containing protein n=1 Tax=Octopus bimaculoides TaxID=37653 RepID=A0A0L8HX15_OCTBM|nr:toll-like receptor 13 [Octopus bimaculoides]
MDLCHSLIRLIVLKAILGFIVISTVEGDYECNTNECFCENLPYIPKFPANTTFVKIINPTFSQFDSKILWNLTTIHLTKLSFIGCVFHNASKYVFARLHLLEILNFKLCKLTQHALQQIFRSISSMNITSLEFDGVNKNKWSFQFLQGITNYNIARFCVMRSKINVFNGSELLPLKNLKILDLRFDSISKVVSWGKHPYLTDLNLYGNFIYYMVHFVDTSGRISFPMLVRLEISLYRWNILVRGTFKGLDKVKTLGIYALNLHLIKPKVLTPLKELINFSLTAQKSLSLQLGKHAFESTTLRSLTLRNITLEIPKSNLSGIFNACRHITLLKFQAVSINGNASINELLMDLKNLEYLELTGNTMRNVPDCVCDMKRLHTLILSRTWIRKWQTTNCTVMNILRVFSLSYNRIFNVNKTSFSKALFSNTNLKWDLSHNSYICNCRILWFRDWMRQNSARLIHYPKSYLCSNPAPVRFLQIAKYYVSWDYCANISKQSPIAVSGCVLGTLSVIFIITGLVSYIKRWSIRYWVYLFFARRRKYQLLECTSEHNYDAFVCYCGSDVGWVTKYLLPILEEENDLHLCLHDRDFAVGNDIVDNIVDSIQQSRKVVLVLSSDFAQSQWCQFETSLAQQRLFEEKKDIIVPILLEEIPTELQTMRLALLLKQKTYLEWSNETRGQMLFWERLVEILLETSAYKEI